MRELKYEPSSTDVCLEIPKELEKFMGGKSDLVSENGIIIDERTKNQLKRDKLQSTIFYEIIKVGSQVDDYKAGDKVSLYHGELVISKLPNEDVFIQCSVADIKGKLVE